MGLTVEGQNKRQVARQPVLKSAKVHFAHSVIDSLVIDFSATGIRLSTELPIEFPDEVDIEMRTGAVWRAARRWQRGVEAGFELLEFSGLNLESSSRAAALYAELRSSSSLGVTERLANEGYFDSPALRAAALSFGVAYAQLEEAFRSVLGKR